MATTELPVVDYQGHYWYLDQKAHKLTNVLNSADTRDTTEEFEEVLLSLYRATG